MTKPYLIAEIGINHNGNFQKALNLIRIAYNAGFDAVKFQKRDIESLYTKEKLEAKREGYTNYESYKNLLEFNYFDYQNISKIADDYKKEWFASVWDKSSMDFFIKTIFVKNPSYIKIPSAQNINIELLEYVYNKSPYPVMISSGFANEKIIDRAVNILKEKLSVLFHCVGSYPTPDKENNLLSIKFLQEKYPNLKIGFSSHSPGLLAPFSAIALGAEVIEIHVTEDRTQKGSDHASSIEPIGMMKLVKAAKIIPEMLGQKNKILMNSEIIEEPRLREGLKNLAKYYRTI